MKVSSLLASAVARYCCWTVFGCLAVCMHMQALAKHAVLSRKLEISRKAKQSEVRLLQQTAVTTRKVIHEMMPAMTACPPEQCPS